MSTASPDDVALEDVARVVSAYPIFTRAWTHTQPVHAAPALPLPSPQHPTMRKCFDAMFKR